MLKLQYIGRFHIKYKVQSRLLRKTYPDSHYCAAYWKYEHIGNFGGSRVRISYIVFKCRTPQVLSRYTIFDIVFKPKIKPTIQQTYQNPILNSGLKSSWAQILLTYLSCPNF